MKQTKKKYFYFYFKQKWNKNETKINKINKYRLKNKIKKK